MFRDKPRQRRGFGQRAEFAHQRTNAAAKFQRPPGPVTFPERHLPRLARSWSYQHPIVRDLDDAPCGGAKYESLAGMRLENHLLIEFANAHCLAFAVSEKHTVEPAIRNGACVKNCEPRSAIACRNNIADSIPREPRPEFRKLV